MKTSVNMVRSVDSGDIVIEGVHVLQRTSDGFFCANSISALSNKWRAENGMQPIPLNDVLRRPSVQEFIAELVVQVGGDVIQTTKGRASKTWVHPYLMLEVLLSTSPAFRVKAYGWIFDKLIAHRNKSGDSYKKMCGALYERTGNKQMFPRVISETAIKIREGCGVTDWQTATEAQLETRDKIHDFIARFSSVITRAEDIVALSIKAATMTI